MNGINPQIDFQGYKRLTEDEKQFFIFDKLCKIDGIADSLDRLGEKYASKWVENGIKFVLGAVMSSAIAMLIWLTGTHNPPQL